MGKILLNCAGETSSNNDKRYILHSLKGFQPSKCKRFETECIWCIFTPSNNLIKYSFEICWIGADSNRPLGSTIRFLCWKEATIEANAIGSKSSNQIEGEYSIVKNYNWARRIKPKPAWTNLRDLKNGLFLKATGLTKKSNDEILWHLNRMI